MSEKSYEWDEQPIENPNEGGNFFLLLPPGNYHFTAVKFERGRHEGSDKLPACNKAIVTCLVNGGALGQSEIKTNLFLHSRCEGLLCAFFISLGHRKHGEPLKMDWGKVVGGTGICEVSIRKGTGKYEGKEFNEIKRFLEPGSAVTAPPAGQDAAQEEIPF
jgi:hypothetical protein